jgi:Carboxypeptidase regulatory-like domain/TonB dependent receptor-like, beta-barrel
MSQPRGSLFLLLAISLLVPRIGQPQGLTGTLIGTVRDEQGRVLAGAQVSLSSPALIGGPANSVTNEKGQLRFQALPPGLYTLEIRRDGFAPYRDEEIAVGAAATIERVVVLAVAGIDVAVDVEAGSRIEARGSGFETRFGADYIKDIPGRRFSLFDLVKVAPGVSPTSVGNGTSNTVSALGSGVNENAFLLDGTNFTCPCSGGAVAEPGIDVIQEVQVQTVGASAEFGNIQGAVFNVVTRQGGNAFRSDASYYWQGAGLTAQPVVLPVQRGTQPESGYERAEYRDFTTNLGGPVVRNRAWFFAGYQYLRDYDSQPGTDPAFPRQYAQDKLLGKLTWQIAPSLRLLSSYHQEFWVNPERPTLVTPFETTLRFNGTVPTTTFAHVTYTPSSNTLLDARVGRFVLSQDNDPASGSITTPNRSDRVTGVSSGGPAGFGDFNLRRTTAKATMTSYRPGLLGADHEWKAGGQAEKGHHDALTIIPTGVRYIDSDGQPFQAVSRDPATPGGEFITTGAFASDAITIGDRLTINMGIRFDHNRAISPDIPARDLSGQQTDNIVHGLGTLYTWNVWSPRLGITTRLTSDGRTMLRASFGRFHQGVLTGELAPIHPGQTPITTTAFDPATGGYTRLVSVVDPTTNLRLDPETGAPRTDEYSVGVDRQLGRGISLAIAYIRKNGDNFIGWTDVGGIYRAETRTLPDSRVVPVFVLTNGTANRRFLLTNQDDYSLTYNGLVTAVEKRLSNGWYAFTSYTWSRTNGLQPSSGGTAADAQFSSTLGGGTFGRDPNSLTNAEGRLPNDRPHMFRGAASWQVPRIGILVAGNVQFLSGKPWAATTQISLPQGDQRILLEPRGTQRLPSLTMIDVRVSKTVALGGLGRVELLMDVLNTFNRATPEGLASDNLYSPNFGQPTVYVDPRRVMLGARLNLGR